MNGRMTCAAIAIAALLLSSVTASAAPVSNTKTYALDTCPVSGEVLGSAGEPVVKEINGREVRFCCAACVSKYEANPAEYEKKTDEQIVAQQLSSYPLETCPVSGEKLGSMGEPVNHVYGNRLVRLCCSGCVEKFRADPAAYISKLDAAVVEKQGAQYPTATCVVMEKDLGDRPVDVVIANRLVRVCCTRCVSTLIANPQEYLKKLDAAKK